jgi:V/A-type H+-transporting ATPase subunit D
MAEIRLTKNELRNQQLRLGQLEKYLPTLQLKKAMLQSEVNEARHEILSLEERYSQERAKSETWAALLTEKTSIHFEETASVKKIEKRYENIAGVEIPFFDGVLFNEVSYNLFDTPPWVDGVIKGLRGLASTRAEITVVEEKKAALEKELREVSIRVNLFEKVLIPRALNNIKKIKVFLGDQELAAVSQAKVAKNKIESRKAAMA